MSFGGKGREFPPFVQFCGGAVGGMVASAATHPLDLAKVLMQVTENSAGKQGFISTCVTVVKKQGFFGLYQGLSASLLRQCTYTMTRVGLYGQLRSRYQKPDGSFPLWQKIVVSMAAGAGGAVVGTPADVILVRMQADSKKPIEKRRNYKNAIQGLYRIAKEEGVISMWKGCIPNISRAMFMSAGQLASYDQAKGTLIQAGLSDGLPCHILASGIAGLVATVITNPLDVMKTRIMNSEKGVYKNSVDCFMKTLSAEGPLAFYKGFFPYYIRLGPHTMITFVVLEQFQNLWAFAFNDF